MDRSTTMTAISVIGWLITYCEHDAAEMMVNCDRIRHTLGGEQP